MRRLALLCMCGPLVFAAMFASQLPNPSPQTAQQKLRPASLPHLYWHFLMWQDHLDRAAAERVKNGKDGKWLSNYAQKQLGFSDTDFAHVRESAQHLATVVAGFDAQAKSLVQADLALYANGKLAPNDPPPDLAKVKQLTQDRENAINDEITRLNAALGPNNAAKLKAYISAEFSSHVTVVINPNPPHHLGPYGPTPQALGLEAQP
jgi:hypothetical protein